MNDPFEHASLPTETQFRIVELCDEYESAWKNGKRPSLIETLNQLVGSARTQLLRELIQIERYYREKILGETVSNQRLLTEYAEIAEELAEFLSDSSVVDSKVDADSPNMIEATQSVAQNRRTLPAKFGRYQLLRQLGEGGMGSVFLAEDTLLERQVALKLPHIDNDSDPQLVTRFYREAKAAATLNHPHLCAVHDVGEIDGNHFLTMEYVEGKSLAELLKAGEKWTDRQIVEFIKKIASALHEAHQRGVIHRDLKPANIMINHRGEPVVTDFGLAQKQDGDKTQITLQGQILGTPAYMSPEQLEGDLEQIGPASDIYSLGVMMFELLTGQRPFKGPTVAVLSQIMSSDPPAMSEIRESSDSRLENICRTMMSRPLSQRFETMQQVVEVMSAWLEEEEAGNLTDRDSGEKQVPPRGWKILAGFAAAALLIWGVSFLIRTPEGTFRVTINDDSVSVLVDQQRLELTDGSWSGRQDIGTHELALKVGEQTLALGEQTSIELDGYKRKVLAKISGIDLASNKFKIVRGEEQSVAIVIEWLDEGEPLTKPTEEPTVNDGPLSHERKVAEWVLEHGGELVIHPVGAPMLTVNDRSQVPTEPFYVLSINGTHLANEEGDQLRQINQLHALKRLGFKQVFTYGDGKLYPNGRCPAGALRGLQFGAGFDELHIEATQITTSEFQDCSGLSGLVRLSLLVQQVDDNWEFLKQLPRLRCLSLNGNIEDGLSQLADSEGFKTSSLRRLQLGKAANISPALINQLQEINPDLTIGVRRNDSWEILGKNVQKVAVARLLDLGFKINMLSNGSLLQLTSPDQLETVMYPTVTKFFFPEGFEVTSESLELMDKLTPVFSLEAKSVTNAGLLAENVSKRPFKRLSFRDSDLTIQDLEHILAGGLQESLDIRGCQISKKKIEALQADCPTTVIRSDYGTYHVRLPEK